MAPRMIRFHVHIGLVYTTLFSVLVKALVTDGCIVYDTITISSSDSMGTVITSPHYPDSYPSSSHVCWLLTTDDYSFISVSFDSYRTESPFDQITIYDGPDTSNSQLGQLSGVGSSETFLSSGTSMFVTFVSDGTISYFGFQACVCSAASYSCDCDDDDDDRGSAPFTANYISGPILIIVIGIIIFSVCFVYKAHKRNPGGIIFRHGARTTNTMGMMNRVQPNVSVIGSNQICSAPVIGRQTYPPPATTVNQPMPTSVQPAPPQYTQHMHPTAPSHPIPSCPPPPYPGPPASTQMYPPQDNDLAYPPMPQVHQPQS